MCSCVKSAAGRRLLLGPSQGKDLGPLEEFIVGTHLANLQSVGDRCVPYVWGCSCGSGPLWWALFHTHTRSSRPCSLCPRIPHPILN